MSSPCPTSKFLCHKAMSSRNQNWWNGDVCQTKLAKRWSVWQKGCRWLDKATQSITEILPKVAPRVILRRDEGSILTRWCGGMDCQEIRSSFKLPRIILKISPTDCCYFEHQHRIPSKCFDINSARMRSTDLVTKGGVAELAFCPSAARSLSVVEINISNNSGLAPMTFAQLQHYRCF